MLTGRDILFAGLATYIEVPAERNVLSPPHFYLSVYVNVNSKSLNTQKQSRVYDM